MLKTNVHLRSLAIATVAGIIEAGCQSTGSPSPQVVNGKYLSNQQIEILEQSIRSQIAACADKRAYDPDFVPTFEVSYNEEGHVIGNPKILVYPKTDSGKKALEQAILAVRRCDPLVVGGFFKPYFSYWHSRTFRFAIPDEVAVTGKPAKQE